MSDARAISVTIDLEDIRPRPSPDARYPRITRELLALFAELDIRATFFVVGELARADPGLIGEIADCGHELGLHSLTHTPLPQLTPAGFEAETKTGRDLVGDIIGQPIAGYRAPVFSLTRQTPWAPDILTELGFRYSSSVLPAGNPLHGFPGAPRTPFRWPSGLIELPAPVAPVGPVEVPVLGGVYFRYLPLPLVRRATRGMAPGILAWNYFHPYDFDATQPFFRMKNTALWVSLLLWFNRRRTLGKFRRFFDSAELLPGQSLTERIAELDATSLPVFTPWAAASNDGSQRPGPEPVGKR